jgi:hypothetical protein
VVASDIRFLRWVAASLVLAACGGGGGGGEGDPPIAGISQAYIKASNTRAGQVFGGSVALSADGTTVAVGAANESSNATGIGGNQADNSASGAGAVYVLTRSGATWTHQAYVKASNTGAGDQFGLSIALSADGNTLAVGAPSEDSNAIGIDGNQADNSAGGAGAVYVFTRNGAAWMQQAYVKASNSGANDSFGVSVALSADGNTLAVGAAGESSNAGAVYVFARSGAIWAQQAYVKASNTQGDRRVDVGWPFLAFIPGHRFGVSVALAGDGNTLAVGAINETSRSTGIDGSQADQLGLQAGAVYVFTRTGASWAQQAYVKASNTGPGGLNSFDEPSMPGDRFGGSVALSATGDTLAVGANGEDSSATGINGNQNDDNATGAGAVYVFTRIAGTWAQQAYVKASNTQAFGPPAIWGFNDTAGDAFGASVALSGDGNTLAVGATQEDSNAAGIGGNQANEGATNAGAVYVFTRSGATWVQQAYVKASNTGTGDQFGASVALSGDGKVLAAGATGEDSNATGIGGNQADNTASSAGAVYVLM